MQAVDLIGSIIVVSTLVRIDPQINLGSQPLAKFLNRFEMFPQAHHTDAVAYSGSVQRCAAREETIERSLRGMEGGPQGERLSIGCGQLSDGAAEVGLDRDAIDVRAMRQG